jgi:regulatory protein
LEKKTLDKTTALLKAQQYCAYQERCTHEVLAKLSSWGQSQQVAAEIIGLLIAENFLSDKRFALAYARDKFRFNAWGRVRIRLELKMRQIAPELIEAALESLDEERLAFLPLDADEDETSAYEQQITQILERKLQRLALTDPQRWQKAAAQALRRGFEGDLVWAAVRRLKDKAQ